MNSEVSAEASNPGQHSRRRQHSTVAKSIIPKSLNSALPP